MKNIVVEAKKIAEKNERVLITTLTKKMAENLSAFLKEENAIKSEYIHSEVNTIDRIKILEKLREGKIDVLVGVNLLREGLDLPEVSLVAILDADKEGFLRSKTSLIQTIGRAARNVRGRVILYADSVTGSMKSAIDETNRRRKKQMAHNKKHHITPATIERKIKSAFSFERKMNENENKFEVVKFKNEKDVKAHIAFLEKEMKRTAKNLQFEKAVLIRDEIIYLKKSSRGMGS